MSTSKHPVSSSSSWQDIVSRTFEEVMVKIKQETPDLLTNTFLEPMKFLPLTPSGRELIHVWLQVSEAKANSVFLANRSQSEEHRHQVAVACRQDLKDINRNSIEIGAAFICLKVEKPYRILNPVPNKTLIIIGLGRLHTANGMFHGVDLTPGGSVVISGDKLQEFDGGNKGGGLGIVLRINYKSS